MATTQKLEQLAEAIRLEIEEAGYVSPEAERLIALAQQLARA